MSTPKSGIRAFERGDLPAVCALYEQVMRSGARNYPPALAEYFVRLFVDDPWIDAETPSLVYETGDGEIVGFIGASARRMRLDGRPIRMVASSNLVVEPGWRPRGVGALLNRQVLQGPQELTVADRANDSSRSMWLGLGGQEMVHGSVGWYRIFRPGSAVRAMVAGRGREGALRTGTALAAAPLDAVARRLPKVGRGSEPTEPDVTAEPLTAEVLLEQVRGLPRRLRLHPDYDAAYLQWLFGELDAVVPRGRVVGRLVRSGRGQVLGWYLYLLPERGIAQILQVAVVGPDPEVVIDHLFWHAFTEGAAAVQGRLEPMLSGVLTRPGIVLRKTARALVHSENDTVLALLGSTKSLLSHVDGEWMVSHGARQ